MTKSSYRTRFIVSPTSFHKMASAFIASVLLTLMAFCFSGCSFGEDEEEAAIDGLTYKSVVMEVNAFQEGYSQMLVEAQEPTSEHDVNIISSEGYSPLGEAATVRFVDATSADGAVYRCATFEFFDAEGSTGVRNLIVEYMSLGEGRMFIAETILPRDDGTPGVVNKYFVNNNTLYEIDEEGLQIVVISEPDTLDLYLSFEEIEENYGA